MHCYPLGSEPKGTQISPIEAIIKKNQRDLSQIYSLKLVRMLMMQSLKSSLPSNTLQQIAYHLLSSEGKGAFLVEADIKEVYRMVCIGRQTR